MKNKYYYPLFTAIFIAVLASGLYGQHTVIKLPQVDSTSSLTIRDNNNTTLMRLNGDGGLQVLGSTSSGVLPVTGAGTRMMWYPRKYAFRAGRVNSSQWDDASIGNYSFAAGYNTTASNSYSVALGFSTAATGNNSTALGNQTTASAFASTAFGYLTTANGSTSTATGYQTSAGGDYSTAMGSWSVAKGHYSFASGDSSSADGNYSVAMGSHAIATGYASVSMGDHTTASGPYSFATGYLTTAGGYASVAMGDPTTATGYASVAIGHEVISDGDYSTALGNYATTDRHKGSFIFGDASTEQRIPSTADHQMTMRFAGGYRLLSEPTGKIGVFLGPGQSDWQKESDSTKKELFAKVNGEYFLASLSKLRLESWNYKGQDKKRYRHYGPMAQDIFHYFGKDEFGTIGCDTTLGTGDMDGIMMICLQALEKRTTELKATAVELQKATEKIALMEKRMEKLEQLIASASEKKSDNLTSNK